MKKTRELLKLLEFYAGPQIPHLCSSFKQHGKKTTCARVREILLVGQKLCSQYINFVARQSTTPPYWCSIVWSRSSWATSMAETVVMTIEKTLWEDEEVPVLNL